MTRVSHDHYISMFIQCSQKASQVKYKTVWERLCASVEDIIKTREYRDRDQTKTLHIYKNDNNT